MKGNQTKWALWGLVVLCFALLVPAFFLGGAILTLAVFLLIALVVAFAVGVFRSEVGSLKGATFIAVILALLASVIAFWSALSALLEVGTNPLYHSRLWVGWLALFLSILTGIAALFLSTRPLAASVLILVSGLVGVVCISLFYINTWYALALPFWILAMVLGLTQARSRARS